MERNCVRLSPPLGWWLNIKAARFACVVFMVLAGSLWAGTYSGGSGAVADPYRISSAGDIGVSVLFWLMILILLEWQLSELGMVIPVLLSGVLMGMGMLYEILH